MLSNEEKRKYIRQIMMPEIRLKGQEQMKAARVAIVGCGGLGCPALLYLASAGVGTIGVIDFDTVNITNLHRQVLFGNHDVGQKKADVAKKKLALMHPEVQIVVHDAMLDESNADELLKDYDIVIDGCDNFATRYVVNDTCVRLAKTLVYASILGFEGQLAVFNFKGSKNLRDIFPDPPDPGDVPDCSENGVLATIPGIMGTFLANECLKVILQKDVLVNKFAVLNCSTMQFTILDY
jgi:adenylyltransferase/sulfurtransferase